MTTFLFLQCFDNGAPAPMPFEAVMEVLSRHGVPGRGRGDAELAFVPDQVAAMCTVAGSAAEGVACIGFERPLFGDPLRRVVWECMQAFGCAAFTDNLDTVYTTGNLPAEFLSASGNGARRVRSAQQLWPANLALPVPPAARPALLYPNPNPNGPRFQHFDALDNGSNELYLELAIHPAACNPGTLRVLRNLELRADAAISANPRYHLVCRYAWHESALRLMESARLGDCANRVIVASPPPMAEPPPPAFDADPAVRAGAQDEADELARYAQDKYQLALDGSSASIETLADLLDRVHTFYQQERGKHPASAAPFHSKTAEHWALKAGCYLGMVIQRQLGGQWGAVKRSLGTVPAVRLGGRLVHPHLQALDHIVNGPGDSVAGWFAGLGRAAAPGDPPADAPADALAEAQACGPAAIEAWPEDAAMAAAIAQVRAALDTWRAGATAADYLSLREGDNGWLRDDPLHEILDAQAMLLSKGQVAWAALVLAHGDLFEPGPKDLPAALVYSRDPHFDARPQALRRIGGELLASAGEDAPLPLRVIAGRLQGGRERIQNLALPAIVTERKVLVSVIAVFRQHLPGGVLVGRSWFPVLVHPYTHAMMIVPRLFWPAGLAASWQAGELTD